MPDLESEKNEKPCRKRTNARKYKLSKRQMERLCHAAVCFHYTAFTRVIIYIYFKFKYF